MSIHLMVVAAYLPEDVVTQGQKLALMKICDSADDETRLSKPGMRRLRAWVGVGEKRCTTIVTELVAKGLVERVEVGKSGRRAVYRVFPLGVPPIPSNDDLGARFQAADAAPKNPRKARSGVTRAKPSKPAMTHEDVDARELAAGEGVKQSGFHGRNPEEDEVRVPPVEPLLFLLLPLSFLSPLPPRLTPQGSLTAARSTRARRRTVAPAEPTRAPGARLSTVTGRSRAGRRSRCGCRTGRRRWRTRGGWPRSGPATSRPPSSWRASCYGPDGKGRVAPPHPKNDLDFPGQCH